MSDALVARRRWLGAALVAVLVVAAVAVVRHDAAAGTTMVIERIDVTTDDAGVQRVAFTFSDLPPDHQPRFVDIDDADGRGLAWTAQDPSGLRLCGDTHWFPGAIGSVDLLVPATWLDPSVDPPVPTYDATMAPSKLPSCGPHRGYVQLSIWGPASSDPADVKVVVEGREVVVLTWPTDECVGEGAAAAVVPDVLGLPLVDAVRLARGVGMAVVGTGTPPGDPTGGVVTAQEPPAGTGVPLGACLGFRTTSR